jgi:galactarate dehydratase
MLGLATTVQCVAPTVEYAAQRIRAEILPRFPNVDGVTAITHSYGCGVAIDAPGAAVPIRTLKHIGLHANLAGQPLVVSLGCEKLQPARLFSGEIPGAFPILGERNVIRLQDERGFGESVAAIMRAAEKRLAELDRRRRQTVPASELVVGLQCGGSVGGTAVASGSESSGGAAGMSSISSRTQLPAAMTRLARPMVCP